MYPEIKMVTKVSADDVRKMCVKYNLFVCGTLRDYDAMLDEVELFGDCTTSRQCVVRLANIIESECVKRCYEIVE